MTDDFKVDMQPGVDPFGVECPRCAAKPGDLCVALSSAAKDEKRFPHPVRVDAAIEAAGLRAP